MADSTHVTPAQFPLPEEEDPSRRDVIMIAAGGFAAVGLGLGLWPLLDMMNPDASALSMATTEVDLAPVAEGQAITVMWRGKPIFIRHRTKKEIEEAKAVPLDDLHRPARAQRQSSRNAPATDENRAGKDREPWLVMIGICTHLGCIPKGQAIGDPKGEYDGWFCPCHGSQYDSAGRVRKGPAPQNMAIPPYAFLSDTKVKIG